jgi:tRNA A-37 threonylcarbamoyl transferase component Bud32
LRAARAGIPVPKVYGFGLIKPFGLVDTTMVMMEYLEGNQSINGLLCKSEVSETVKIKLLNRVGRLLTKLYEGCCNHIDLNSRSIWIGEKEIDDKIIDFQYVTFLPHPSISVLIFHMAYFSTSVRSLVSEEILDNWVREQLAALSAKNIDQWMALYRQFRFKRLSRKQRLNIK